MASTNINKVLMNGIKQTVQNAGQIIIVLQCLLLLVIIFLLWKPVQSSSMITGIPKASGEEETEAVEEQEEFAQIGDIEKDLEDKPLTEAQPQYDRASFRDYYEYGLYPQWYGDYPSDHSILSDSMEGPMVGDFKSVQYDKDGNMDLPYPSGMVDDVEINRSTSTWGSAEPDTEFSDEYEYGNYPGWYSSRPASFELQPKRDACNGPTYHEGKPPINQPEDFMWYDNWSEHNPQAQHSKEVYKK